MIKYFLFFIILLQLLLSCDGGDSTIVGKFCNGAEASAESDCNIPQERWGKQLSSDFVFNIVQRTKQEIKKIELGVGVYKDMDKEEKESLINSRKSDLSVYEGDNWKSFVRRKLEKDQFYTFSSGNKWPVSFGYIIVRDSKVIASFYLVTQ